MKRPYGERWAVREAVILPIAACLNGERDDPSIVRGQKRWPPEKC